MVSDKTLKRMIGNPFSNSPRGLMRDSDGDGVVNGLDCEPLNPRKQGFIHDIVKRSRENREISKSHREEARTAAMEERRKETVKTAIEREKYRGEQKRKFIRSGGFSGAISRGFSNVSKATPRPPAPRRTGLKKVKKGKKGKRRTIARKRRTIARATTQPQKRKPLDLSSLKFDF